MAVTFDHEWTSPLVPRAGDVVKWSAADMSLKTCPQCGLLVDKRHRYCGCGYDWAEEPPPWSTRCSFRWRRWKKESGWWPVVLLLFAMLAGVLILLGLVMLIVLLAGAGRGFS
jgi:hypothetical protein